MLTTGRKGLVGTQTAGLRRIAAQRVIPYMPMSGPLVLGSAHCNLPGQRSLLVVEPGGMGEWEEGTQIQQHAALLRHIGLIT